MKTRSILRQFLTIAITATLVLAGDAVFAKKKKKRKKPRKPAQVAQTLDQALQQAIDERKSKTENFRSKYADSGKKLNPFEVMPKNRLAGKKKRGKKSSKKRLPAEDDLDLDLDE